MNKILILLTILILSGCTIRNTKDIETIQESQEELQSLYDFIEAKKEAGNYSTGN